VKGKAQLLPALHSITPEEYEDLQAVHHVGMKSGAVQRLGADFFEATDPNLSLEKGDSRMQSPDPQSLRGYFEHLVHDDELLHRIAEENGASEPKNPHVAVRLAMPKHVYSKPVLEEVLVQRLVTRIEEGHSEFMGHRFNRDVSMRALSPTIARRMLDEKERSMDAARDRGQRGGRAVAVPDTLLVNVQSGWHRSGKAGVDPNFSTGEAQLLAEILRSKRPEPPHPSKTAPLTRQFPLLPHQRLRLETPLSGV
jgi:hypothetical protein